MKEKKLTEKTQEVVDALSKTTKNYGYLELAVELDPDVKAGRGIGRCMKSIGESEDKQIRKLCSRVCKKSRTRRKGA